jgi:hypothetical protein
MCNGGYAQHEDNIVFQPHYLVSLFLNKQQTQNAALENKKPTQNATLANIKQTQNPTFMDKQQAQNATFMDKQQTQNPTFMDKQQTQNAALENKMNTECNTCAPKANTKPNTCEQKAITQRNDYKVHADEHVQAHSHFCRIKSGWQVCYCWGSCSSQPSEHKTPLLLRIAHKKALSCTGLRRPSRKDNNATSLK